ncbi:MAG: hypothetical protein K9M99_08545 [Candidatus Cloacimonetes bacterium]|nr:hypothetical protein [Candidatus Cloacimonadota bacterium]
MKNKLALALVIIFLLTANALIAQNPQPGTPPPAQPAVNPQAAVKPLLKHDFSKPLHHNCMARRRTVLSLARYQENIDLDKKLKTSNEMLY